MGIARCVVVVVVDGTPPNGRGSPILEIGLQTYFLDFPVDD